MLLGWLITAAGTMFGAPFWFDTLQRVVRLKSSGPKPQGEADGHGRRRLTILEVIRC
jgi:hypothetical protein